MKSSPVVHFEMPAKDRKRVSEFYSKVFGWNMKQLGEDMGNYIVAQTTETDENNMVKTPGNINGGFWQTDEENVPPHVVIAVDDIEEATKEVEAAGGKVVGGQQGNGEPDDIPGIGIYSSFIDTEGNRVGMLQPHTPMR
ncbi:MAG: VOC family protein [Candidatus Levyibacteriota bacterium]